MPLSVTQVLDIVERVYRAHGWQPDDRTSRDARNEMFEAAIAAVHYGHPWFNATPDPQWHIKRASADRPQSDDVVVSLPSRNYYDLIGGAGAPGWQFSVGPHNDPLPAAQIVYPPQHTALFRLTRPGPVEPPRPTTPAPPSPPTVEADLADRILALMDTQLLFMRGIKERLDFLEARLLRGGLPNPSMLEHIDDVKRMVADLPRDPRFL
jgi:hypothetical protein